jgi:hypothetical protein
MVTGGLRVHSSDAVRYEVRAFGHFGGSRMGVTQQPHLHSRTQIIRFGVPSGGYLSGLLSSN